MPAGMEAQVMRKVAWRIIPFVMLLYFIAYIDRVNIGFSALTMNADLGLSPSVFGFGAGIFFWGYFLFEVPSNVILARVGARLWIARVMVSWGLVSGAMAFVWDANSFYVMRFLLGAAEAGFFPGIIFYLSAWFPAHRRSAMTSLFMAAAPISVILGSPVSAALLELNGLWGLRGWQWLFILEAAPAVVLGVVTAFYLTDRPEQASWLHPDERDWLVATMAAEQAQKSGTSRHSLWSGLLDLRVLALALVYFGTSAGLYTLGIWAPQIIKSMGLSNTQVGWVNAVPPLVAVAAMYAWSWHSDRHNERTWHVAIMATVAAIGLVLAGMASSAVAVVAALTLVNIGISAAKPPLWSMPTLFLSGTAAATGIATINAIGNLGGFVGPAMIGLIKDQTGSFAGGLYFVAGLLVFSALLVVVLSRVLMRPALPTLAGDVQ